MTRVTILPVFLLAVTMSFAQRKYTLTSPDKKIKVEVSATDTIRYSISVDGTVILQNSAAALQTDRGTIGKVADARISTFDGQIVNPIPFKRRNIRDNYQQLELKFKNGFSTFFRVYDDGVAYRFALTRTAAELAEAEHVEAELVEAELANFSFASNDSVYAGIITPRNDADIFHTSFEEPYTKTTLNQFSKTNLAFSPLLVRGKINVLITESDLFDYPGMFLSGNSQSVVNGVFPKFPKREDIKGGEFRQKIVSERESFIAKLSAQQSMPWRVIVLARTDKDLLTNDLVYRLGRPAKNTDWSWVKPGISTEEWICGSNLHGVDFQTGVNTATYKYYIDFASRFGLQYVMLDAGWSDHNDLTKITPGLDLGEIAAYAKTKNIDLILWTLSMTLDRQLDEAISLFKKHDIKVIMTDFMDRNDQPMVKFYERIAQRAAENKMMVMFHGAFPNAGFERTFPNAIARESVLGSEYNIWSDKATPEHDLIIPFIRMAAGPMDYEPGFMTNVNRKTFRALADNPMSMGTRTHQLAMFVAYDSPLQLFSGNPSDAYPEVAFTTFLGSLPTTWDETIALDAKLGDYLVVARRKERDWYLVAMTDWSSREIEVKLSFLANAKFRAFTVEDGINAEQNGRDYRLGYQLVDGSSKLEIHMAPGGGFVAKLIRLDDARP